MKTRIRYGRGYLYLTVPDGSRIIQSPVVDPVKDPIGEIVEALAKPIGSKPLSELASKLSRQGKVVVVVPDITRPVPNQLLLEPLLNGLAAAGVECGQITILIATGMHRPSTSEEKIELVGEKIAKSYRMVDHRADEKQSLIGLNASTPHGQQVWVNKEYFQADLKIITGFIEPHMMAGYSGGRKSICPGLVNLETIQQFHGPDLLDNPNTRAGGLAGNPCHQEALAVAEAAGVDFMLNVVVNPNKEILAVFAGHFEQAHAQGVDWFEQHCTISDVSPYDIIVTCGGGYPLDTTFYQAVKGMIFAQPIIKPGGTMVIASSCSEGIGSDDYRQILFQYSHSWEEFMKDIFSRKQVRRDQWELQVQCDVLKKIGKKNLLFVTDGIDPQILAKCNVTPATDIISGTQEPNVLVQTLLDQLTKQHPLARWAVIPDGPYVLIK